MALMTLDEAKQRVETDWDDATFQSYLDATAADIEQHAGTPEHEYTLVLEGGDSVWLPYPAASVMSVSDYQYDPDQAVEITNFVLESGGARLVRSDGSRFNTRVSVRFTTQAASDAVKAAQARLLTLHATQNGMRRVSEGSFSAETLDFEEERQKILMSICHNYAGAGLLG